MALKLRDLVARLRIVSDKKAVKQAEDDVTSSFKGIEEAAKKVGKAIAGAFAIERIFAFLKGSSDAAVESEAIWNRVAGAVERTGASYAALEPKIKAAARAMLDAAGVGDEEFAAAYDRVIALTGDATNALNSMGLVADVAARFFGNDLAPAADLVGRVLTGQTKVLRGVGIVTKDATEGLRLLQERSENAANNELASLERRFHQLHEVIGDVREEIGFLIFRIFGGDNTERAMNRFKLGLEEIAERLRHIRGAGLTDEEKAAMNAAQDNDPQVAAAFRRLGVPLPQSKPTGPKVGPHAPTSEETSAAREAERIRQARALRSAQHPMGALAGAENVPFGLNAIIDKKHPLDELGMETLPNIEKEVNDLEPKLNDFWQGIQDIAENAAFGISGAFQDMFELILSGNANLGTSFETLGRGIFAALAGAVAQEAGIQTKREIALGIGKLAEGTWPPNPAAIAAAGLHFKDAGLWAILGGLAGATQHAVGGSGRGAQSGGVPSGATDIGGRISQQVKSLPAEIHVHIDPFDKDNPVHQREVAAGVIQGFERQGYKVITHSGRG